MTNTRHSFGTTQKPSATDVRSFRSFLLMRQFAAREIGARIAEARKLRGMTQDDLADSLNVSKRSVQDYEAGVTIPYKHFQMLGTIFDRELDWFLYGGEAGAAAQPEATPSGLDGDVAALRQEVQRLQEETAEAQAETQRMLADIRGLLTRRRSA